MVLRDYQQAALDSIRSNYNKGIRRQLINMSTGSGKTQIFSHLPESMRDLLGGQTLILAHREELLEQAVAKLRAINPNLKVAKEMAGDWADTSSDVIVASTATLGRKGSQRASRFNWDSIDKVITDECHHASAQGYQNIYELAGLFLPDSKKLHVGFTATPQRSDGKSLAEIYERIVYVYSLRQAIEDGWLVDIRGFRVHTDISLDGVSKSAGDFKQDELEDVVNNSRRNNLVVQTWKNIAAGRQTVAFCVGIKHANDLARSFEEQGVAAAAVWGEDPHRAEKLRMHREGKITVLCNCSLLVEGYDDWRISCIILSRPTKSAVLFTQMVGRGTRLQDGLGNLKEWLSKNSLCLPYASADGSPYATPIKQDCIVIDVVDSSSKHSLVTLPTLMGLPTSLDIKGRSLLSVVQEIENEQERHPSVDFAKLKSIDDIKALIESVNMFDLRFPEEVEANSELTWFKAADGGYRMLVPKEQGGKTGKVSIRQNMLDQWEVFGTINDAHFHGIRPSMEEIFKIADEQVRARVMRVTLSAVKRKATWHKKAASPQQLALLKKFYPYKQFPSDLTKGQASRLLGEKLAGKAR